MNYAEYFDDLGLLFIHGREPFDLGEFYDFLSGRLRSGAPEQASGRAIFHDLSEVDLGALSQPDLRRFITQRRAIEDRVAKLPCAVLVSDLVGFGMIRMFSIFAEISDLRDESTIHPTTEIDDAAAWVASAIGHDDPAGLKALFESARMRALGVGG